MPAAGPLDQNQRSMLQILANQLGLRLGMIRVMSETSLAASTDSLTGLVNRRRLETSFSGLLATGTPVSLVLGRRRRLQGAQRPARPRGRRPALRAFAAALRARSRPDDVVCRYGGEEFVVVLPRCSAEDAQRVFQRVQKRVGMIGDDGRLPRFTASYGVTIRRHDRSRRPDLRGRRRRCTRPRRTARTVSSPGRRYKPWSPSASTTTKVHSGAGPIARPLRLAPSEFE